MDVNSICVVLFNALHYNCPSIIIGRQVRADVFASAILSRDIPVRDDKQNMYIQRHTVQFIILVILLYYSATIPPTK